MEARALLVAKSALRAQVRAARAAVPPAEREAAAEAVARRIAALPELAAARLVLGYCARSEEIDPFPALVRLRAQGARIAYPRVTGPGTLDLHEIGDERELEFGSFSIREPVPHAPRVAPGDVDAVIVPGVAFDAKGRRMGYGGGFYDRLLPQLPPGCPRIAIAFDEQVVDEVPADTHDQGVDLVVTPSRIIVAPRR